MSEEIKKIRRRKPAGIHDKRHQSKGRKSRKIKLKENGLPDELKDLANLVAGGVPMRTAGSYLGLSDYKIKTYTETPQFVEELEKLVKFEDKKGIEKIIELTHDITIVTLQEMKRRIMTRELKNPEMIKLFNDELLRLGLKGVGDNGKIEAVEETRRKFTIKGKKLFFRPADVLKGSTAEPLKLLEEKGEEKDENNGS